MRLRRYSLEIYSVITILIITFSAIFVSPDLTQKLALAYAFLFLLHMWEETVYPGGFFDMLFGEIINIEVPNSEKLIAARLYPDVLVLFLSFLPYFGHKYIWLILPVAFLGIVEGCAHTGLIKLFKLNRLYTPGMITALCQFALSIFTFYILITNNLIEPWQYLVGFIILILGLMFMQVNGMRLNNIKPTSMPKMVINNLKRIHGK